MRMTVSPGPTPASTSPEAIARTSRRVSFQVCACHCSSTRWWKRARSPYFAAWRKKTPSVVRPAIAPGSRSSEVLVDGVDGVGYLTALMVRESVPEGTLTVTLSPFFLPTSALPTGESTEILPADGSLSTAPTR